MIAIPIVAFFVLLLLGVEIAYALISAGIIGLLIFTDTGPTTGFLESTPFRSTTSYVLTTIPMFLLMAGFAEHAGVITRLFALADQLLLRVRGGLAYAVVGASSFMGALSGDSIGTTAAMARIAVPEMTARGYSSRLALGAVASAGTIAIMIPPSIALVLYGILTETPIGALLLAGIVPGILTAAAYAATIFIVSKLRKEEVPQAATRSSTWAEKRTALGSTWPFLIIVAVVVGSIYGGLATATEAAAIGALATLVAWIGLSLRTQGTGVERFGIRQLMDALNGAARMTVVIMILLIGANLFGYFLTVTGVTRSFGGFLLGWEVDRLVVLLVILLMYIVLGCFLSQITILVLTLPIIAPVIVGLDYDMVWFGVIVTKMAEIGLLTPPVGLAAFVAASASGLPVSQAFRGTVVFLCSEVVVIALLIAFPDLALFIPRAAGLM